MVYFEVMEEFVREIVENDLKGCYEIWGDRIRVCYGYSFLVSFDYEEDIESCFLYYGIFWRNLFLILKEGLKLMKCQYVYVSIDKIEVLEMGRWYGREVVFLVIDVECLRKRGFKIYKVGKNVRIVEKIGRAHV